MSFPLQRGQVKSYYSKGFGFILRKGASDVFFHIKGRVEPIPTRTGIHLQRMTKAERNQRSPSPDDLVMFFPKKREGGVIC